MRRYLSGKLRPRGQLSCSISPHCVVLVLFYIILFRFVHDWHVREVNRSGCYLLLWLPVSLSLRVCCIFMWSWDVCCCFWCCELLLVVTVGEWHSVCVERDVLVALSPVLALLYVVFLSVVHCKRFCVTRAKCTYTSRITLSEEELCSS